MQLLSCRRVWIYCGSPRTTEQLGLWNVSLLPDYVLSSKNIVRRRCCASMVRHVSYPVHRNRLVNLQCFFSSTHETMIQNRRCSSKLTDHARVEY